MNKRLMHLVLGMSSLGFTACNFTIPGSQSQAGLGLSAALGQTGATPAPIAAPIAVATATPTATLVPTLNAADFKIVIIGSSTAEGAGSSTPSTAWVSKMYADMNSATGVTLEQNNLALAGLTSADLITTGRSDRNITKAISYRPNLIIVALAGGNDISNGISETQFLENLDNMRGEALANHIAIFFTGTSPKNFGTYSERQELKNWNEAIQGREQSCTTPLRNRYAPCFINVFTALADPSTLMINSNYAYSDGVHLNDRGHSQYESVALPIIKEYVCSLVHCVH